MEVWLELARGPMFRFCFALLVLGLLRVVYLALVGVMEACRRRPDKKVTAKIYFLEILHSLFAVRAMRQHPLQSFVSMFFHSGLLIVSLFLAAHVLLWRRAVGFAWPALPESATRAAAFVVMASGVALFAVRLADRKYRAGNSRQELIWPLLILIPIVAGFLCANVSLSPLTYQWLMFIHVCAANLVMALVPFTKITQAVLAPFSRLAPHIHVHAAPVADGGGKHLVWVLEEPDDQTVSVGRKERK